MSRFLEKAVLGQLHKEELVSQEPGTGRHIPGPSFPIHGVFHTPSRRSVMSMRTCAKPPRSDPTRRHLPAPSRA